MPGPSDGERLFDEFELLPGQRLPWDLPWEPDQQQEEDLVETNPNQIPDEDEGTDEDEEDWDTRSGSGAAIFPLSSTWTTSAREDSPRSRARSR